MKYKTKCCNLEYFGDNHNPVRSDGYCMNCGLHPLQQQLKERDDEYRGIIERLLQLLPDDKLEEFKQELKALLAKRDGGGE